MVPCGSHGCGGDCADIDLDGGVGCQQCFVLLWICLHANFTEDHGWRGGRGISPALPMQDGPREYTGCGGDNLHGGGIATSFFIRDCIFHG